MIFLSIRLNPKSYAGMEEHKNTNTTTKRKILDLT